MTRGRIGVALIGAAFLGGCFDFSSLSSDDAGASGDASFDAAAADTSVGDVVSNSADAAFDATSDAPSVLPEASTSDACVHCETASEGISNLSTMCAPSLSDFEALALCACSSTPFGGGDGKCAGDGGGPCAAWCSSYAAAPTGECVSCMDTVTNCAMKYGSCIEDNH